MEEGRIKSGWRRYFDGNKSILMLFLRKIGVGGGNEWGLLDTGETT